MEEFYVKNKLYKTNRKKNNGIITRKKVTSQGIESWYLTDMVKTGNLERVQRGIYLADSLAYDELYFFQIRYTRCIFSYQTALYLHNLTDRIPYQTEVTVPQGYNASHLKNAVVHFVKKEWYEIGIETVKTPIGNSVNAYNMERTICDLIRERKNQDTEIFSKAIHNYLKSTDKDIWKLREYAEKFHISNKLEDILEVLDYE